MLSCLLCVLFTASSAVYDAYVTSTGNNNTFCSSTNPCGAIQFVFANIDNGHIIDDEMIITINGVNPSYDLFCGADIKGDITLIFDTTTIKTSDDWWCGNEETFCEGVIGRVICHYPITIQSDSTLKIYNMPLDSAGVFAGAYDGSNQRFYCENCIFNGPPIDAAKFIELTFVHCTFNGSLIGGIGGDLDDQSLYERDAHLNISHSTIINLNYDFVTIYANPNYKRNVYIDNVTMISSERFIYVYNAYSFSFVTNEIDIRSSTFIQGSDNYDDKMVVLYVDEATQIDIRFDNASIEYSNYLDHSQVASGNYDDKIPIYIGSATAEIAINNLTVKTNVRCSMDYLEWTSGRRRSLLAVWGAIPDNPWCNAPLSFLYNDGIAILSDIRLETNFIESYGTGSSFAVSGNHSGIGYLPSDQYDFSYSNKEIDNLPYFSAIINGYDAVMEINNLYVAIGAYYGIIFNSGKAHIDNVYTEFAQNPSAFYNPWNLALVTAITNNIGSLKITNSKISGCEVSLIDIYGGDVRITNTILSQSTKAIRTYYTAESIHIDNLEMYEVSVYYTRVPILSYRQSIEQRAVTHLSAHSITITNSSFYIFDAFGALYFDQKGLISPIEYGVINNLSLLNNRFIDPRVEFPGYKRLTDFSFLYSLIDIDPIYIPKMDQNVVFVDHQYLMSFAQNVIHFSNQSFPAYVHFDTNTNGNCMASNSFYNVDLYIKSGNFSSCKHKEITTNFDSCLSNNLGLTDHTFTESYFVNSSLIIDESFSIILDDAVFDNPSEKNPFYIVNGATNRNQVLVMLDVMILNHEVAFPGYCDIVCHQFIDQQISYLRQFTLNCAYNSSLAPSNETAILTNSSISQSFSFWNPDIIMLSHHNDNNNESALFPGQAFQIDYSITDKYGNIVNPDYYPSNITINLVNSDIFLNSFLVIDFNGKCQTCETVIDLAGITINNVDQQYLIQAQVADDILVANDMEITIRDCPSGYGVSSDTLQCEKCLRGHYTIESNLRSCHVCPDDLYHVECPGSSMLIVEHDYWMEAEINSSESSSIIIHSDCPNNYCCQLPDGCDYLLDEDVLCALNRDPLTPLCGQCKHGYSELIGTTNCGKCEEDHYEFFIIPLVIAILFSIYLLCFDVPQRKKKQTKAISADETPLPLSLSKSPKEITTKQITMDDWRALMVMLFKVLLYFAQGLSFVLLASPNINGGLMFYVLPILQVWSLGIDFGFNSGDDDAGFCLFKEMTALQEILLNLTVPAFILLIISTILFVKWMFYSGTAWSKCRSIGRRQLSFTSAYLRGLLVTIGSVLASIFKILNCRKVGDDEVHFYYGSEECYDGWWFLSLFGVLIIFIVWTIFDVLLFKMMEKRQKRRHNYLWTLISAYKPKYWWWETLLLSRRTFLALFTIVSDSTGILNNTLTVMLCIYFGLQIWAQPFKYKRVNRLETICILILIIVVVYVNNVSLIVKEEDFALGLFLLACVILPGLILLYEFVKIIKHLLCPSLDGLSQEYIQKIEMRRPTFSAASVQIEDTSDHELDDNDDDREESDDLITTNHRVPPSVAMKLSMKSGKSLSTEDSSDDEVGDANFDKMMSTDL